ncbi:DUF262 domain-containing protein [Aliarcobacter cryaerophilus]|uniref:GmrSD restriction endonucleases N-terminal domain-containing protein n=1 Tax=Aliarcobacter cryaerophilus TaxID=28198 RepID=A0A2S9TMJ1_9BACT|nr:DUF262 domain-containing protein [Aliarcobacter cryaerophilus]PRN00066.1 hypothetical protein CJ668_08630 [Arcobacter cryaerophilus gv. pseudocryaerophilus]
MSTIRTIPLNHPAIMKIYAEKDEINLGPEYQRHGSIWSKEKKQLLIDSIINDYDIPKIYFHELQNDSEYKYSVIDGRQRLQAIWEFMDGIFPLADDFKYFENEDLNLSSLTYNDLANKYPKIRIKFDSTSLPIVIVQTNDIDLIEDMFLRLNEAVPLNASEKRNAIGGYAVKAIRDIAKDTFFISKMKINNNRYQFLEIAAKLLYLEECISKNKKIIDTSKSFLDRFVENYKNDIVKNDKSLYSKDIVDKYKFETKKVLVSLNIIFSNKDILLKRQGDIPIYYLLIRDALNQGILSNIDRQGILKFQEKVDNVSKTPFEEIHEEDYTFYEYYSNTQQGTNSSSNIRARVQILESFFEIDYKKSLIGFYVK